LALYLLAPMSDITPYRPSKRIRFRTDELSAGHYAVVERMTNRIIIAGFDFFLYAPAWSWIALDFRSQCTTPV